MRANIKDDFKDLLEYRAWVNKKMSSVSLINSPHNEKFTERFINQRIKDMPEWYGENANYQTLSAGISTYSKPELITKIFEQVNDKIPVAVRDRLKAKKIKYNPNGLGVFCFDRAAMGMYKLKEYYSTTHQKRVDESQVSQHKNEYLYIPDQTPVIKRWEKKVDGKPKIRTTTKDVFAYFPKVDKDNKAVELFIISGGYAKIKAEAFLYSGIAAVIVAQLLEKARVKLKISIVVGSSPDDYKKQFYGAVVPVKNYDENLDINLLALLTSDPRFFRYEGFKGIIAAYEEFNAAVPDTLGTALTKYSLIKVIEESDYAKRKHLPINRFYFGGTYSETDAIDQIKETINEIAARLQ